uniref:Cytochrome b n=2 Tax=Lissoclinum patella TaxID=13110 RepID=A0A059VIH0_9ASCI|nr:cytochrome b [Lissoclinum patella]
MLLYMKLFLKYPTPLNLNYMWNGGSLLGFFLFFQIMSGVFLSMFYNASITSAFESITLLMDNIHLGSVVRYVHMNGASMIMAVLFFHLWRGLFFKSYYKKGAWFIGMIMMYLIMFSAFLGYVLPWGQMSFWGATVITSLLSVFPGGVSVLKWVWGGFSVGEATLGRFYTLHFIIPFLLIPMSMLHLFFIHKKGSNNPVGIFSDSLKIFFWPYYMIKDLLGFFFFLLFFFFFIFFLPVFFGESDNFIKSNPMNTPTNIVPEWYFLFAYAILRCIPNKSLGVLMLFLSLLLFLMPLVSTTKKMYNNSIFFFLFFYLWSFNFLLLMYLGGMHINTHVVFLSQLTSFFFFFFFFFI